MPDAGSARSTIRTKAACSRCSGEQPDSGMGRQAHYADMPLSPPQLERIAGSPDRIRACWRRHPSRALSPALDQAVFSEAMSITKR